MVDDFQLLTIAAKISTLEVCVGRGYACKKQ